jgi:hypothetical protein
MQWILFLNCSSPNSDIGTFHDVQNGCEPPSASYPVPTEVIIRAKRETSNFSKSWWSITSAPLCLYCAVLGPRLKFSCCFTLAVPHVNHNNITLLFSLLGLLFDPKDGGCTFLRNARKLYQSTRCNLPEDCYRSQKLEPHSWCLPAIQLGPSPGNDYPKYEGL